MQELNKEINLLFEQKLSSSNTRIVNIHYYESVKDIMVSLGFNYIRYDYLGELVFLIMAFKEKQYSYLFIPLEDTSILSKSSDDTLTINEEKMDEICTADFFVFIDKENKSFYNIKKATFFNHYDTSLTMSALMENSKIYKL
jgi:hypothetical protein